MRTTNGSGIDYYSCNILNRIQCLEIMIFLRPPSIIKVVRRTVEGSVYIGRPTIFQNPTNTRFDKSNEKLGRDAACYFFEEYFWGEVDNNEEMIAALRRLERKAKADGELLLGCFCAPKRCHGDTIKEYLDQRLAGIDIPQRKFSL